MAVSKRKAAALQKKFEVLAPDLATLVEGFLRALLAPELRDVPFTVSISVTREAPASVSVFEVTRVDAAPAVKA